MAKLIKEGDTIIANSIDGNSRKIVWKGLKKHPITKELMMLYECDRNSFAEITTVYTGGVDPGTENYCRNIGDQLQADAISIYVSSLRKEKFEVSNATGRHKSQFFSIRKKSISSIKTSLEIFAKELSLRLQINQKEI